MSKRLRICKPYYYTFESDFNTKKNTKMGKRLSKFDDLILKLYLKKSRPIQKLLLRKASNDYLLVYPRRSLTSILNPSYLPLTDCFIE